MNLEAELNSLQETGTNLKESGEVLSIGIGVAVLEAVMTARQILDEANREAGKVDKIVSGVQNLTGVQEVVSQAVVSLKDVHEALAATFSDCTRATTASLTASVIQLEDTAKNAVQELISVSQKQIKENEKSNGKVSQSVVQYSQLVSDAVVSLIQELRDGVSVSIENQDRLPVADVSAGVSKVSEAVPVLVIDHRTGKPIHTFGGGGGGGVVNVPTSPTVEYRPSDQDEGGATKYYGFLKADGGWYIMTDTGSAQRYFKGASGYAAAWTARASHSYDYFDVIF